MERIPILLGLPLRFVVLIIVGAVWCILGLLEVAVFSERKFFCLLPRLWRWFIDPRLEPGLFEKEGGEWPH